MKSITLALSILMSTLLGCATSPTHPSLSNENLPRTIPVRQFVANTDHIDNFNLSPDGKYIAYNGVANLRSAIRWKSVNGGRDHAVTFNKNAPYPIWSGDSRYLLYTTDATGRENYNVFVIDTLNPEKPARNLTPTPGAYFYIAHIPNKNTDVIYVGSNERDPEIFDIYQYKISTGSKVLLHKNTDNVVDTTIDDDGNLIARIRQTPDARILEINDQGKWSTVINAGVFDFMRVAAVNSNKSSLYLLSNVERDRVAAVEINLATKAQSVLYEHPEVDVDGFFLSPKDQRPLMAFARPGYPHIHFIDKKIQQQLEPFFTPGKNGLGILSVDRAEQQLTTATFTEAGATFNLINLTNGTAETLGEGSSIKNSDVLRPQIPIQFKSRDDLTINGYLTLPQVADQKNLPTVVLVHGGPWARDTWGYRNQVQFLANRGYAVLQINYRGSAGYGREFLFAAEGEFAGKMHTDLIDGVDWAIEQGVTDPTKVAIMGGSYGGYAALVGMTMTPTRFACGIDIVGVSDLVLLWETVPTYWKNFMPFWERFIGNPANPKDKLSMEKKSPVNFAHQVQGPLLIVHGANDPRVVIEHSNKMVAALQQHNKPVEYIVIDDEGHSFQHWKHQMTLYRKTEDFLANCLGGRSGGLDFYQLGSWAF